jgi:multidrug efflux system membrane fusion protein
MTSRNIAAAAALSLAWVGAACRDTAVYTKPITPVTAVVVGSSTTGTSVRYSGTVKPALEVVVSFKVGGYVEDILTARDDRGRQRDVQEGDRIAAGAVLARVRSADYEQRVAQARAGVTEGEAMRDAAQLDFDRSSRLFERRSLTKPEYDAAKARLDAATARIDGARAMLREAELLLDDVVLRSPISGVLLRRAIERGSLAGPGAPAFTLADRSTVKVAFGVSDVAVRTLTLGRPQRVAFDALKGEEFEGRVTSIAPAPDPVTRVYEVDVTIPNADGRIAIGFIASLELTDVPGHEVVTVPLESIVKPDPGQGDYAVFVVDGVPGRQLVRLRSVALGEALGNEIAVTSGLKVGEQVVVRGATLVVDGEEVLVLPPSGTP